MIFCYVVFALLGNREAAVKKLSHSCGEVNKKCASELAAIGVRVVRSLTEPKGGRGEREAVSTGAGYKAAGLPREMHDRDPTRWVRGKR